jgi:FkbM family methyltransferase
MKHLLKALYAAIPFKQPLFTFVRAVLPLPESVFKHLHFKGVFRVKVSNTESFLLQHHGHIIENELFWRGLNGWERVSLELWVRLSRKSKVIFDIGANTGLYSLISHATNPEAVIYAAEPMGPIFEKLQRNLSLNNAQVHALCCAISDHDGTAEIFQDPENVHMLDASLNPAYDASNAALRPLTVAVRTVASILEEYGLSSVDLLKIDVETHEPEVLAGFLPLIQRDRPTMLIEILNDDIAQRLASMVDGLGYLYFNIDDKTWPPVQVPALTKSAHFNFLLCRPEVARSIGL